MDDIVLRSVAKWPDVPAVYGWLALDRRGNWLLRVPGVERFERIGNAAFRDFIARNYGSDARGCWYFQNGPQRVYVRLAYTPFVVHFEAEALVDHCGTAFGNAQETFLDDEGSVLIRTGPKIALLDDRDLGRFADSAESMVRIARADVAARFGYVLEPQPEVAPRPPDSLR